MNDLEKEFEELCKDYSDLHMEISPKIKEQIIIAKRAIANAIEISEVNGVPFTFMDHEGTPRDYIPTSILDGKYFSLIDKREDMIKFIENIVNISISDPDQGYGGWISSNY